MEKFQNKIIAISGEPVTGKGTNVRKIHEKLLEQGYKEENIHLVSTGEEFRRYFGIISDLIRNIDNPEILREIAQKEKMETSGSKIDVNACDSTHTHTRVNFRK